MEINFRRSNKLFFMNENLNERAELALQAQCFQWHWNSFPDRRRTLFHVNGKAKNAIEGSKFKSIGVVRGISDLILIVNNETIYIELKTEKGTQSKEQKEFEQQVLKRGQKYYIIRSFTEFKNLIMNFYGEEKASS